MEQSCHPPGLEQSCQHSGRDHSGIALPTIFSNSVGPSGGLTAAARGGHPPAMSDAKLPLEDRQEAGHGNEDAQTDASVSKSNLPLAVALAFVIVGLLGVLIATVLKSGTTSSAPDDGRLATLQSDVDARRSELNRQRIAMG